MIKRWCNDWYSVTALVALLSSIFPLNCNEITSFSQLLTKKCWKLWDEKTNGVRNTEQCPSSSNSIQMLWEYSSSLMTAGRQADKADRQTWIFLNFWILWYCTNVRAGIITGGFHSLFFYSLRIYIFYLF